MPRLRDQLEAKRETMNDDVRRAYEAMVAELQRTDFLTHALQVGDRFPDLVLPNAEGALVSISALLEHGPLVVTFFRGEWCPYCRLMLDALAATLPEIMALGASLVAVTPEAGGRALTAKQNHKAGFEVLCDVDCGVGLSCGVVFRAPEPYRLLLLKYGTDLAERHGNPSWFLPVPATFVVDRQGIVRWRFLSVDFTERAEPADLLAALRSLPAPEG
ncbi:MAG TPA: peroxiredoxin-like family protein [Acetobacteraceae bacterium]|nr:peroxiredoxin-like family protein [Acetobacteraceae bacterium]